MSLLRPLPILFPLLALSCSVEGYREEADSEVYQILADKESQAIGEARDPRDFRLPEQQTPLRVRLIEALERGETPRLELDLEAALEVAAVNSRQFQDQKESLYLAALALTGQRNRYSSIFAGSAQADASGTGDTEESRGNASGSLSVSKILGSGARVLGSFINTFFRVFTSGDEWNASSLLSLSITQPLLEGFGSEVTLEPLTQAERNVVYAIRRYERFRRTFAVDVITEYLAVLQLDDNLENQASNFASLTQNRERSEELSKAGRLPKFQVDQARQQELSAQDRKIVADARHRAALDRFKITLGLPMEVELVLDEKVFEKLRGFGVAALSLTEEEAIDIALAKRLDLKNAREQLADADRQTRVAANALQLGLDLSAALDVPNERSGKPYKMNWHRFEWELGLAIDLPLNKVPERNVYRQSLIALGSEERSLSLILDQIMQGIRDELRDVRASFRSYRIQENSLALASQRVESTLLLIDAGRADTRDYLEAEQSLLSARIALTGVLVDYMTSKLRLLRDLELVEIGAEGLSLDLSALELWTEGTKDAPGQPEKGPPETQKRKE